LEDVTESRLMRDESPATTGDVAYEPPREFVESTNVWQFMQEYGVDSYEELIELTTTEVEGVPSGVDWFWDVLPEYLGIEFFEPYDQVRDDSEGPQWTEWYPGGTINVAHNDHDRQARTDSETRNTLATIWDSLLHTLSRLRD
jgi:acetyl-CoA synthetase